MLSNKKKTGTFITEYVCITYNKITKATNPERDGN